MAKVVGYLRVSTDRQAEEGFGLDVQEQKVRGWAKAEGHKLVAIYRDEGISGSKGLGDRPGLADAVSAVLDGAAAGIVVPRLDRLARDLIVQEQALAEVWRLGGEVWSCSAAEGAYLSDDPDDPSRKLIRQVLGAVSEYERSMVALRLRMGRKRKFDRGGYAYGAPPFGKRAEGKALIDDPAEMAAVGLICSLREDGKSYRQIVRALVVDGHRTKRGGAWHPKTVSSIVQRFRPRAA